MYKLISILFLFTGCTLSFQNVSTNGRADDVIDENQTASPNVKVPVSVPKALPI